LKRSRRNLRRKTRKKVDTRTKVIVAVIAAVIGIEIEKIGTRKNPRNPDGTKTKNGIVGVTVTESPNPRNPGGEYYQIRISEKYLKFRFL